MMLLLRVRNCCDDAEYEMLRQHWDTVRRPQYARRNWSPKQEEALGALAYAVSLDDEEQKCLRKRCLFVSGGPGSGKSAVLLELAVRSAKRGHPRSHRMPHGTTGPLLQVAATRSGWYRERPG